MSSRNRFLRKPKDNFDLETAKAKYEIYNLKDSPFPSQPFVNRDSDDARYNGSIYEDKIRQNEFKKIHENFLSVPQSDMNHIRIGFIMDTSYIGRGNGKSAFCINLYNKINKDYCLDLSNDLNKCFGIYLVPEVKGRTKSFSHVTDILFDGLIENNIIRDSLVMLRLEAIGALHPEFNFEDEFSSEEDVLEKLNNVNWYREKDVSIHQVTTKIMGNEYWNSVKREFPLRLDKNRFQYTGIIQQDDFVKHYQALRKPEDKYQFIFNDLVAMFLSAGFNGSYVIIDDFERIPYHQSEKQKREFALDMRTYLYDGVSLNSRLGFYNFLLILHAGVPRLIEKAWGDSGMEQRAPITNVNRDSKHVVFFEKMDTDNAVLMIKRYLEEYRIDSQLNIGNELSPFDRNAIQAIGEASEFNAAQILRSANLVLERASEQKQMNITSDFIRAIINPDEDIHAGDDSSGIKDGDFTDLMKKVKENSGDE